MERLRAGRRAEKAFRRRNRQYREEVQAGIAAAFAPLETPNNKNAQTRNERDTMTTVTATSYEDVHVPEDTYVVKLASFSEPKDGDYGRYVYMRTAIVGGDDDGKEISTVCSLKLSPKSKLRGFIEVFLGRVPEPGEDIDLDALAAKGPKAKAVVITKAKEDGTLVSVVERLLKPQPRAVQQPQPAEGRKPTTATIEDDDVPF